MVETHQVLCKTAKPSIEVCPWGWRSQTCHTTMPPQNHHATALACLVEETSLWYSNLKVLSSCIRNQNFPTKSLWKNKLWTNTGFYFSLTCLSCADVLRILLQRNFFHRKKKIRSHISFKCFWWNIFKQHYNPSNQLEVEIYTEGGTGVYPSYIHSTQLRMC